MKFQLILCILISISSISFSQDYLDKIASESCDCIVSVSDTLDEERFNLELGLCILESSRHYEKELKRDHKINFDKIDMYGEKLGTLIGLRMAGVCPDALISMVSKRSAEEDDDDSDDVMEGEVINIDDSKFVEFSVKDESGKISKFYWFTFIDSNMELSVNYKKLSGEFVLLKYKTEEFFDARIGEYRNFNIITKLEQTNK